MMITPNLDSEVKRQVSETGRLGRASQGNCRGPNQVGASAISCKLYKLEKLVVELTAAMDFYCPTYKLSAKGPITQNSDLNLCALLQLVFLRGTAPPNSVPAWK